MSNRARSRTHGPLDDCSSSALPLSYSARHTGASRRAHELNVRTSRRSLVERSTAELLGATCLDAKASAESNPRASRRLLVERSTAELLTAAYPGPTPARESNARTPRRLLAGCSTTELLTWYLYVPPTGGGITPISRTHANSLARRARACEGRGCRPCFRGELSAAPLCTTVSPGLLRGLREALTVNQGRRPLDPPHGAPRRCQRVDGR